MSALGSSFRRLREGLTYANVMSTLAVVLVLGTGTAYAAGTIGSADVVDDSLRSVDVKDANLKGVDVADNSLRSADVAGLNGADVADDSLGSADVAGLVGADIVNDSLGSADVAALVGGDLEDGSLDGSELAPGSVDGSKVLDGSLSASDLSTAARTQLLPSAVVVNGIASVTDSDADDGRQTVFSTTVQPGTYVVQFSGDAYNPAVTSRGFNCIVTIDGTNAGEVAGATLGGDDGSGRNQKFVAISGFGTASVPSTMALECLAPVGAVTVGGRLMATRVAAVTN